MRGFLRPFSGLSSLVSPSCDPSRFRGQVWDRLPRSGLPQFSHHKRVFFRLRSAGSACFHRVHRVYYLFRTLLLAPNTCIRCTCLGQEIGAECTCLGQLGEGTVYLFGAARFPKSTAKGGKLRAECTCLGQAKRTATVEVISFHFHGRSLSAREQAELPGRDGRLGGSKL